LTQKGAKRSVMGKGGKTREVKQNWQKGFHQGIVHSTTNRINKMPEDLRGGSR